MSQGKPRDLHKEQYWRQLIQRWQASDLSIRAFCRQHHLAIPSFYAWRRTLRERDRSAEQTPPSLPPPPCAARFPGLLAVARRLPGRLRSPVRPERA